jgi:hypothetical protein
MLTGDFLFEPRNGPKFSKDDDHLAQIQELTMKFSRKFCASGLKSRVTHIFLQPILYSIEILLKGGKTKENRIAPFLVPLEGSS